MAVSTRMFASKYSFKLAAFLKIYRVSTLLHLSRCICFSKFHLLFFATVSKSILKLGKLQNPGTERSSRGEVRGRTARRSRTSCSARTCSRRRPAKREEGWQKCMAGATRGIRASRLERKCSGERSRHPRRPRERRIASRRRRGLTGQLRAARGEKRWKGVEGQLEHFHYRFLKQIVQHVLWNFVCRMSTAFQNVLEHDDLGISINEQLLPEFRKF